MGRRPKVQKTPQEKWQIVLEGLKRINSRWPRPIGIIESMAFSPVCSGCLTGSRSMTLGARDSMGRSFLELIGPLPSMG